MPIREQPPRSAFDRNSFPPTISIFARHSSIFEGKANVVGNEEIQMSIAVVIHERTAGPKLRLIAPQPRGLRNIGERSVAVVAVKHVLTEISAKDIVKAIVVVVSDADSGGPPKRAQPCFFGDVHKRSVAVVFVQPIRGTVRSASEPSPRQHKQIHPPIIIVINERAAAS